MKLSTGKELGFTAGGDSVIGINPHGCVYSGYDVYEGDAGDFTDAERRKIADEMIRRWEAFASPQQSPR